MTLRQTPIVSTLLVIGLLACARQPASESTPTSNTGAEGILARAIADRATKVEVDGEGKVIKLLVDDYEGNRHQRFIIRLASGQTLLIAHNIDEAPRVESIKEGDTLSFRGEYEWNERGGVIHWTHVDRSGHHPGGWLKHNGRVYQ